MESKELRIGNWIYHPYEFKESQIEDYYFMSSFIADFKPIPLTEEWLFKFGFDLEMNQYIIVLGYDF